jgi:serine/threonine protein kinase
MPKKNIKKMNRIVENSKKANPNFFSPSIYKKRVSKRTLISHQGSRLMTLSKKILKPDTSEQLQLGKHWFIYNYVIGRGGFGKVWKVENKKTKEHFALKEMLKLRIISKRSVHSVMNERRILEVLRDPFIVNMHYAFQDRESLFLVLDLKNGGDLRYHIGKVKRFTELQGKFIAACIACGLNYIHSNGILHRDIKPENLVFDERGYLYITDFGIARVWTAENAKDTSGTPGYMSPEVIFHQNHGIAADYFALGVILFEIIVGRRPYCGRDRKEIRDSILTKQAKIVEAPEGWSAEAADFVNRMIQRKASNRLGCKGFAEVKDHPWLKDFPWKELCEKSLVAPFVPKNQDNFDPRTLGDWKDDLEPGIDLAGSQSLFSGYSYDSRVFFEAKKGGHKKSLSLI